MLGLENIWHLIWIGADLFFFFLTKNSIKATHWNSHTQMKLRGIAQCEVLEGEITILKTIDECKRMRHNLVWMLGISFI